MNDRPSRGFRLLFLVPLALVLVMFGLLPGDQLRIAEESRLRRLAASLLYDRGDLACFAHRGLNVQQGRRAGREAVPLVLTPDQFNALLDSPPPAEDRFFLEYPHWSAWVFGWGWSVQTLGGQTIEPVAGVLDSAHNNVAQHVPRSAGERQLWKQYATAVRLYLFFFLAAFWLLGAILHAGYGQEDLRGAWWLLLMPAMLYISFSRFDILPAVLVAASLATLAQKRYGLSGVLLGAATVLKVYPAFLVPLLLRFLWPLRSQGNCAPALLRWTGGYAIAASLALAPLLAGEDLTALLAPYRYQLFRPPEFEFTFYGTVLPVFLAEGLTGSLFRFGMLGALLAVLLWCPIADLTTLLRRGSILLLYLISVSVFYSPQWLVWLAPLLIPLTGRLPRLVGCVVALDLVSYAFLPGWFLLKAVLPGWLSESQAEGVLEISRLALIYARFAIVVLTFVTLSRQLPQTTPVRELGGDKPSIPIAA